MDKYHIPSNKAGKRDKTFCGPTLTPCVHKGRLVYSGGEPYQAITTPEPFVKTVDVCLTCRVYDGREG